MPCGPYRGENACLAINTNVTIQQLHPSSIAAKCCWASQCFICNILFFLVLRMTMSFISSILLSFLWFIIVVTAQKRLEYSLCLNNTGFYTTKSNYEANLNTLLSDLTSNTKIDCGFYNISYGQNSDKVSGIGLCRGDIKPDACRGCLHNATIILPQVCPFNKEAWGGYDECILHYSNLQRLHFEDSDGTIYMWNTGNTTAPWDQYEPVLRQLLERLKSEAASGDSLRKFAAAHTEGPDFQTIFAVSQCTPDLSKQDCEDCLTAAISGISSCCTNKIGGRVIKPSCNLRYELYPFYDAAVETPASPPQALSLASPPQALSSQGLYLSC